MLRRTFLEEAIILQSTIRLMEGQSLSRGERKIKMMFERATNVLMNEQIANIFGSPVPRPGGWPNGGMYSQEAAYLAEAIWRGLRGVRGHRPGARISQPRFVVLQRVAYHGSMTIDGLMDPLMTQAEGEGLVSLIERADNWARSLQDLLSGIDIVRAWTDTDYRRHLQVVERYCATPSCGRN
jgi:hypothetical protein